MAPLAERQLDRLAYNHGSNLASTVQASQVGARAHAVGWQVPKTTWRFERELISHPRRADRTGERDSRASATVVTSKVVAEIGNPSFGTILIEFAAKIGVCSAYRREVSSDRDVPDVAILRRALDDPQSPMLGKTSGRIDSTHS